MRKKTTEPKTNICITDIDDISRYMNTENRQNSGTTNYI